MCSNTSEDLERMKCNVVENYNYAIQIKSYKTVPYTQRAIVNQTKPIRVVVLAWEMAKGGEEKHASILTTGLTNCRGTVLPT